MVVVSRPAQMLASVYAVPLAKRKTTPLAGLMDAAARHAAAASGGEASGTASPPLLPRRRARIWELDSHLHCSIIGTCLTAGELRRLLIRLKVGGAETADEHDAHMLGVLLAARPQEGAKLLQKALDRRHGAALNRFARAADAAALAALWEEAVAGGDIPGAYWALLTHPLATNEIARRAFGDVHMLSHLVGATNRADLARLRALERQNAALAEKIERQERQLREGFVARDATIVRLSEELAQAQRAAQTEVQQPGESNGLEETIAGLEVRLAREGERRAVLGERIKTALAELEAERAARLAAERERDDIRDEAASIEAEIGALLRAREDGRSDALALEGLTILYVGGRAGQVPLIRALIERCGGRLLHHDGGIEHNAALLPGLVARADLSLFPVDCVSHDAVAAVKRVSRQAGRPYRPLRTASLGALVAALAVVPAQAGTQ
jgi:Uncharacterized protein conserved in bacteria (DUF2325)